MQNTVKNIINEELINFNDLNQLDLIYENISELINNDLKSENYSLEKINEETFYYNDLTDADLDDMYNVFKNSYEKSTGVAWDKNKFIQRSQNWIFYGDKTGYVAVRPQKSGYYKLTGVAGSLIGISKGLNELLSTDKPVWGVMTDKLANILSNKFGFIKPNAFILKQLIKFIPNSVFGDNEVTINNDGSISINYSDVGSTKKYFVGNKKYFSLLLKNTAGNINGNKILFGIKKLLNLNEEESLNELRANPEKNIDQPFEDFLNKILNNFDRTKTFVSFRRNMYVTDINRNNKYNTPTGFYSYPLSSYEVKENMTEEKFRNLFPYQSGLKYMFFFVLNDFTGILTNNTPKSVLDEYARKIMDKYSNVNPVRNLCELYLKNEYNSMYMTAKNDTHEFWLFLYDVIPYLTQMNGPTNKQTRFNLLCREIGVNGFIDYTGDGFIHSSEPKQAVFFQVKSIGKVFVYAGRDSNSYVDYDKVKFDDVKHSMWKFKGEVLYRILMRFPQLIDKANISSLDSSSIIDLIRTHSNFIDKFDVSKLKNSFIVKRVLMNVPDLITKFDLSILDNDDIVEILSQEPQLIDYFKQYLSELNGTNISNIITYQPQLIDYLKPYLSELDGTNITNILRYRPDFVDRFDLSKLNGYHIEHILNKQPQLINKFDLSKLNGKNIKQILLNQSHLVNYFNPHLNKLDNDDIAELLQYKPFLINWFDISKLGNSNIVRILIYNPKLINEFKSKLSKLMGTDIRYMLFHQPTLIEDLKPYLSKLNNEEIQSLISHRPELKPYFNIK